ATTFRQLLASLTNVAKQSGATADAAEVRAEQVLIELQGALVVSRGVADLAIFKRMLARLPNIILHNG
ncbi:hypothetical protein, partial [Pseudomonas azotoformans]